MLKRLNNKIQVVIDQGLLPAKKVNVQNVIDDPTEEQLLEFGEIMAELSADNSFLDGVILTTQTRYVKD